MNDETTLKESVEGEIKGKSPVSAALLSQTAGLSGAETRELQEKALWRMAAVFRNAEGSRVLCEQYGFSRNEAEEALRKFSKELESKGDTKVLEPTYDHATGKYLGWEEWLDQFIKQWDKIPVS